MQFVCYVPVREEIHRYTYLHSRVARLAAIANGPDYSYRSSDPPQPDACAADSLPGLTPLTFFWPQSGQPQVYIERSLLSSQDSGWVRGNQNFPDLATALHATSGHILVCKGLGKTTALLYAFWGAFREYANGDGASYIPCWIHPGDDLLRDDLLAHCPPVLFFVDLQELPAEGRLDLVQRMAAIAKAPTCQHHRFVIAYRGWRKPQVDPVARKLMEFVPLILEVKLLGVEEAVRRWTERGFNSDQIVELSKLLRKRIDETRPPETPNNLPAALTSFVGREREMAEVKQLLFRSRLLTLTGPGGCGKTRLALEVAQDLLEEYPEGVWLVELAALEDPARVPQAVASALGVREEPGRSLTETLLDYLQSKQLLLVLDNCEHLIKACAHLVEILLQSCSKLRVLVTSREVLNIPGEQIWGVPPLSLSDPQHLPRLEELMQYEAIRLFTERAQSRKSDFALTDQNAPVVVQICQRLDGLPLAIELAAARVRVLSVEQIATRLNDRFRILTGGSRIALPRHQTLRATVDWSYDLLGESERMLLNRLSVFAGGFTLEAAEAVGVKEDVKADEVLGLLSRLVDRSLVMVEGNGDGSRRYRLLDTLRQYGRERLAVSGDAEKAQCRHATYFMTLAEKTEPKLKGAEQAVWLDRLEMEHDNLRIALRWARETGDAEVGLRLVGALWWFWHVRGYYTEGQEWLVDILALAKASGYTAVRAKALNGAGVLAYQQGDHKAARHFWEEGLAIWQELDDKEGVAKLLNSLASIALAQGDLATARSLMEESLAAWRELGDKPGIAALLNNLGLVALEQNDYAAAHSFYEEGLALKRGLGDWRGVANSLHGLGDVAFAQSDYATARSRYEESLEAARKLGDKQAIAHLLEAFVFLATVQGQPECALQLAGAAAALREAIGAPLRLPGQTRLERYLETAQQALGGEASAKALTKGRAMTVEQAIEYALETVA